MESESSAHTSIWTVKEGSEEECWAAHDRLRPDYGDGGFMKLISNYHDHPKSRRPVARALAHDVACGSARMAEQLFAKIDRPFDRVIATDSKRAFVKAMRARYKGMCKDIEYTQCTAAGLGDMYEAGSADLIMAAQCMPILDAEAAISSFARVLRPGGTLAISFYGWPHFTEDEYRHTCQPLFNRIMALILSTLIEEDKDRMTSDTRYVVAYTLGSWLDDVNLSSPEWEDVQRLKWNFESAIMSLSPSDFELPAEVSGKTTGAEPEMVIKMDLPEAWKRLWTFETIKEYVYSSFPNVQPMIEADAEIVDLLKALDSAMGGNGAERAATWPVALVLARRGNEGSAAHVEGNEESPALVEPWQGRPLLTADGSEY